MTKDEAIEWAGRKRGRNPGAGRVLDLAAVLGITHGAVSQWGDAIPIAQQYRLAALSRGRLKVDDEKLEEVRKS